MIQVRIKKEFLKKRVAFGKSAAPLSKRTDLLDLAITALESKDPSLLGLFEDLPPLAVLKKTKTDRELAAVAAAVKKGK